MHFSPCQGESFCADLAFEINADFNGIFEISIAATDDGGQAHAGVDTTARSCVIHVASVNDRPVFTLLLATVLVLQPRAPAPSPTNSISLAQVELGPLDERDELLAFTVTFLDDGCPLAVFASPPIIYPNGTLMAVLTEDKRDWSCVIGVRLSDSEGGISELQTATLQKSSVNTAPTFAVRIPTVTVLERDTSVYTFVIPNFITNISKGEHGEEMQAVSFTVTLEGGDEGILRYIPRISTDDGTLRFEAFRGEHGKALLLISLTDSGGTAHGGADMSHLHMATVVVLPLPRITSVTPALGAIQGNTRITIRGSFLSQFALPICGASAVAQSPAPMESCRQESAAMSSEYDYYWHDWRRGAVDVDVQGAMSALSVTLGGRVCQNATEIGSGQLTCYSPPLPLGSDPVVSVGIEVHEDIFETSSVSDLPPKRMLRSAYPPRTTVSFTYVSLFYGANSAIAYGLDLPTLTNASTRAAAAGDSQRSDFSDLSLAQMPHAASTQAKTVVALTLQGAVLALCELNGQVFIGGSLMATAKPYSKFVTSWNGREEDSLGFGIDGVVRVLMPLTEPLPPHMLLVAGSFTRAYQAHGPVLHSGGIAMWNTSSREWHLLAGNHVAATVFAVVQNGSMLYVAGIFRDGAQAQIGCRGICALNFSLASLNPSSYTSESSSSTHFWSEVGGGVSGGAVLSMLNAGRYGLIVGGSFNSVGRPHGDGGKEVNSFSNLARWDGLNWHSMGHVSHTVRALAVLGDNLYVGGDYESVGGQSLKYLSVHNLFRGTWSEVAPALRNLNAPVKALQVRAPCVFVAGSFTEPSPYIVRFCHGLTNSSASAYTVHAVPGSYDLGPVNVLAVAPESSEATPLLTL